MARSEAEKKDYLKRNLFRLLFFPITSLVIGPCIWFGSMISSLSTILNSKGKYLGHFDHFGSYTWLFYQTRAINIKKFTRSGFSPFLGTGNMPLARCFHYTLPSLYWYSSHPASALLTGGIVLFIAQLFWSYTSSFTHWYVWTFPFVFLFSPAWYAHVFRMQNYNILGWMFFPFFLWGLHYNNYYVMGGALLLASFGSFTSVVVAGFFVLTECVIETSLLPIIYTLPAVVKTASQFIPLFTQSNTGSIIGVVLKAIGANRKKAKYVRPKPKTRVSLNQLYFIVLYLQFALVIIYLTSTVPIWLTIGLGFFVLNYAFIRFADDQSMFILLAITACMTFFISPSLPALISLWIALCPIPTLNGYSRHKSVVDIMPIAKPHNMKPVLDEARKFMKSIPKNAKVLASFEDPGNNYDAIFDGLRHQIEVFSNIANREDFLFLPEYWTAFALNFEGADPIWGRSDSEIESNVKFWNAEYLMVYNKDSERDISQLEERGYSKIATLKLTPELQGVDIYRVLSEYTVYWTLLKGPKLS